MSRSGAFSLPSNSRATILRPEDKVDVHGVDRGDCNNCSECPQFVTVPGHILCAYCGCPPAKHSRSHPEPHPRLPIPEAAPSLNSSSSSFSSTRRVSECVSESESEPSTLFSTESDTEDSDSESASSTSSGVSSYASGQEYRRHRRWRADWATCKPPGRIQRLLEQLPAGKETRLEHAWNPADSSPNIQVLEDDPTTFFRNPVYKSTDCIRTKKGYRDGLHIFEVRWPQGIRGTHPMVGVATAASPLSEKGYKRLVGSNKASWGWCIKSKNLFHDSRKYRAGVPYPSNVPDRLKVPTSFYMIMDMDKGTLSYQVGNDYLGVAFSGLKGKELYPIVSAVWGNCEVTLRYIGSHELGVGSDVEGGEDL